MGQVSLQVADALEQSFPDGQFDLVWSMESGEHMPDKSKVTFFIKKISMAGFASSCCRRNGSPCIHLRKTSRNKFVTTEQKRKTKNMVNFLFIMAGFASSCCCCGRNGSPCIHLRKTVT